VEGWVVQDEVKLTLVVAIAVGVPSTPWLKGVSS
jgi:hypothetical protein